MDPKISYPLKIGIDNQGGEASYTLNNASLIIESKYQFNSSYPDHGCSFEFYINGRFLEIETLGPISHLKPNKKIIHQEK
jgi:hypothetical protein